MVSSQYPWYHYSLDFGVDTLLIRHSYHPPIYHYFDHFLIIVMFLFHNSYYSSEVLKLKFPCNLYLYLNELVMNQCRYVKQAWKMYQNFF